MIPSQSPAVRRVGVALWALTVAWSCAVAVGFFALFLYGKTPGREAEPTAAPPAGGSASWRLVIGVHPRCPCTRAATRNLRRLMIDAGERLTCEALIYTPAGATAAWDDTPTVRELTALPRATRFVDPDGVRARDHGILTSGGVVLYDGRGAPRFHGGLTPSRGHEGACAGVEAILAIVAGRAPSVRETPTYGCELQGSEVAR